MKIKIAAILIALSTGIIMSCSSNKTKTADENSSAQTASDKASETNAEAEETYQLNKYGAGPNKGIVIEAGDKNHIEMVVKDKDVMFYPLDDLTNPIDINGWTGKAIFQYKDGTSATIPLMLVNGSLKAAGANSGQLFTAIVTLNKGGESISTQFNSDSSMK